MRTTIQKQTVNNPLRPVQPPPQAEHPLVAVWLKDPQTGRCYCRWVRDR